VGSGFGQSGCSCGGVGGRGGAAFTPMRRSPPLLLLVRRSSLTLSRRLCTGAGQPAAATGGHTRFCHDAY